MWQFFLAGLRVGLRGKSFQAVLVLGLLLVGVAFLSASFSPRQPRTVALDVGLSGIRLTLVLLSLFWVQELVAREIDRRTILFSLTYPVSRAMYLLGRYLAVLGLLLLASLLLGLCLLLTVVASGGGYMQEFPVSLGLPYWIGIAGLFFDASVVAAAGLWVATVSTVSAMPLAVGFCFAIGGRALGATVDYLARGADGDADLVATYGTVVEIVRWVLPDLSRLDWREWAMYGLEPTPHDVGWALVMAVAYSIALVGLAIRALAKREFS